MARKPTQTRLPAPFLRRISILPDRVPELRDYPFSLPWLADLYLDLTQPVTVIVGENGSGKSTLIEAIGALAGYDEAGGGKGYRPVDHSTALDRSGSDLAVALRGSWLPKVTDGWFFRAESFFSVARYLDAAAHEGGRAPPDFLSHSHGEGFLRFFSERVEGRQGFFLLDEPESALSPNRQLDLLRLLAVVQTTAKAQVIMATHSPLLMAVPGAQVLEVTRDGFSDVDFRDTRHFRLYRQFITDPSGFVADALVGDI